MNTKKVYNVKFNELLVTYCYVTVMISFLFSINIIKTGDFEILEKYFICIFIITIGYLFVIIIQFKKIIIQEQTIIFEKSIFKSRSIINIKDIENVEEHKFPFRAGLDHLLIQSKKRNYRIYCRYVKNYNQLKKNIMEKVEVA